MVEIQYRRVWMALLLAGALGSGVVQAQAQQTASPAASQPQSTAISILNATEAAAKLPSQVFFRGQSATVQMRNSSGLKLPDGMLVLSALVDTSGYSSSVQQRYQGYLITEVPLMIEGKKLVPGEYGIGFVQGNTFAVMDVGAHDLFTTQSTRDAELHRAMPLQILAAPQPNQYRLYFGRSYVTFSPAS